MTGLDRFIFSFLNVEVAARYWVSIAEGFLVTTYLGVAVIAVGIPLGLVLAALRSFRIRPVNVLVVVFADVFRALPPLMVIIILFFAFPYLELSMSAFTATWVALTLVLAAFAEEIFWAGILAVPLGQQEASRALGLRHHQTLRLVVLPQAVRLAIPPLTNRAIAITKGTALGSVVALHEILNQASSGASESGNATPMMLGAAAYLILFVPFVALGRWVETRFAWKR
mgnify:CR=1 FL=1